MRRVGLILACVLLLIATACGGGGKTKSKEVGHPKQVAPPKRAVAGEKIQTAGLVNRQNPVEPNATFKPIVNAGIVTVNWADLQPNGANTPLVTTAIDNALASAKAAGTKLKLKVYSGRYAPAWTMTTAFYTDAKGGPCLYDPPDTTTCIKVPRWWTTEFKAAYNELWRKLALKYEAEPTITDVQASRCTTLFAEPFLRQATDSNNRTALVNKGFTQALDDSCLRQMIDIHNTEWPTTKLDLVVHPYQVINADKSYGGQNEAESKAIMDYCRSVLTTRCVVGYTGLGKTPDAGSPEEQMFNDFATEGQPVWFQTATLDKIGGTCASLVAAINTGLQYRTASVELPAGYDNVCTVPDLQGLDTQLEANAI